MDARAYWEKHAESFAALYGKPTWFDGIFRRAIYDRVRMTAEKISETPAATVLDVGCGPGENSVLFLEAAGAARVVGVDLASEMIDRAEALAERRGVASRCSLIRGDFMKADLGDEKLDYAVALGVMDYLCDPTPMLAKMRQHARRAVIASFPGFAPARVLQRRIRYALRGLRVCWFWWAEIERFYKQAGFASCKIERCTSAGWLATGFVDQDERS